MLSTSLSSISMRVVFVIGALLLLIATGRISSFSDITAPKYVVSGKCGNSLYTPTVHVRAHSVNEAISKANQRSENCSFHSAKRRGLF